MFELTDVLLVAILVAGLAMLLATAFAMVRSAPTPTLPPNPMSEATVRVTCPLEDEQVVIRLGVAESEARPSLVVLACELMDGTITCDEACLNPRA